MAEQGKRSGGPRMTIETASATTDSASQASSASAPKSIVESAAPTVAEPSGQATVSKTTTSSKPRVKVQQPPQPAPQPVSQPAQQPAPQPVSQQVASEEWRQEPAVAQPENQQPQANVGEASSSDTTSNQSQKTRMTVGEWVHKTFPGHENAFYGAMVALLVALLVFIIGVWRTLLLGVLVLVGVAIGQMLDGDPKIINAVRGLFESDRSRQ